MNGTRLGLIAGISLLWAIPGHVQAQDSDAEAPPAAAETPAPDAAATDAAAESQLPEVEVIQQEPEPPPQVTQQAPPPEPTYSPAPQPPAAAPPPQPVEVAAPGTGGIDSGTVLMSPVGGSEIPITQFPGAVGRASSSDILDTGNASIPEVLQNTVPGVVIGDARGNIYQRNLQYRGFEASPVNGVPIGLAVYQNGVRINESFGDTVNWDFLPDNAIEGITIIGANPVYGLNALGGAVAIVMRDGFNFQGVEIDSRFGSYGHAQGSVAVGAQSGIWGVFASGEWIEDDGFRDFSEAKIQRGYFDVGLKNEGVELHLNYTAASSLVGVTAAAPVQLLDLGWNRTFSSPQTADSTMNMVSLNGSVKATPTLTFSGVGYYRWLRARNEDGNIAETEDEGCDDPNNIIPNPPGVVCFENEEDPDGDPEPAIGQGGVTLEFDDELSYGTIDRTTQDADSYGVALQAVEKTPLFGLPNQFLIGASYDHGKVDYTANSELGFFGRKFVVQSFQDPFYLEGPDDFEPNDLTTENTYGGIYFSNTTELTSDLALTLGGRWNYARVKIEDNTGENPQLNGDHRYYRFNPMAGATYQIMPGMTLFGGYSEANRAPTPAELACADPDDPCLIESFLTADPPLDQVVSRTFELGMRGNLASLGAQQRLDWTAGLFRTKNEDDIIAVASPTSGRGYFQNAGDTLRQGIEAGLVYTDPKWQIYANYAFIDATFESSLTLSSPDNPVAFQCPDVDDDEALCVQVNPGDQLPGVPRHRFKAGVDYWVTSKWRVGGDLVAVSDQYFFGDEGNDNPPLAGYAKVDVRSSYDITENIQVYGMVDNIFDSRYGIFGNFFNLEAANEAGEADGLDEDFFTNPRTITPAAPVTAYGGVRVRF